ncbi:MAG TPA: alkaline phosphatase family protein [Bryobacteraceae bacterium]|nr:alkaline phosphatase family protein [Bryobacteraceae bacterium]
MDICRRKFGACILAGWASRALALPPRPKLLVLLVLEHMRPDYLDAVWAQVAPGGLRKIVDGGAFFPDCRHLALSFSSSSLATLSTGAWPAQHGIVADTWYDRPSRRPVRASDEALLATTLTSQVASAPGTRAFVISLTPTEGALMSGNSGARLYWMDDEGRFTGRGALPGWVPDYNRTKSLDRLHNATWVAVGANPQAPPLRTLTFDRSRPQSPQEFLALYRASPFAQAAQFDFLKEMLVRERLGQGETLDYVCLVASSSALLGYETGARSPLMQQMTLQLDRQIELLINQLDQTLGARTYNLVLAGAHGGPPAPAPETRPRMAVNGELLAQAIQQGLTASGSGRLEKYLYPFLYLDSRGSLSPEPARQVAGRTALDQPAVAAYYTAGGECSIHDDWERRFRNSFHPRRAGDVILSYQPEYIEDFGAGRGISYGSLYDYDIRTPLCFYGPQFRAAVFEAPVESVDLAPTLARAMGVAPPSSSTGRVLGEAFAA